MPRTRPVFVLLGALLLASCAAPAPKPPPLPPPPPAPPPRAARLALRADWSFRILPNACLADAAAGRIRLELAVRRNGPIRLTMTLPTEASGRPVAHFHGPAGTWLVAGWRAGPRGIAFSLGRDLNSLSRVLILLSGGVLDVRSPGNDLPVVTLGPSGADGQRWFDCARGIVT